VSGGFQCCVIEDTVILGSDRVTVLSASRRFEGTLGKTQRTKQRHMSTERNVQWRRYRFIWFLDGQTVSYCTFL